MQKLLMRRKEELEAELVRARGTDFANFPADAVGPGTVVELTDLNTGQRETLTILGAWDSDPDKGIISYLSPVAQALMGHKPGEEIEFELHGAVHRHRIENIQPYRRTQASAGPAPDASSSPTVASGPAEGSSASPMAADSASTDTSPPGAAREGLSDSAATNAPEAASTASRAEASSEVGVAPADKPGTLPSDSGLAPVADSGSTASGTGGAPGSFSSDSPAGLAPRGPDPQPA